MRDYPPDAAAFFLILAAVLGLVFGSALGCLVQRLERGESWTRGRSRCDSCGRELAPRDLVPVFSYLALRGKCRFCGAPIGAEAPVSEAALGVVFAAVTWRFGLTAGTLQALILCSCLFCVTLSDLHTREIPDRFAVTAGVSRLAFVLLEGGGWPGFLLALRNGAIFGGAVLLISLAMNRALKKESMGGGDIKLLFALGMYFSVGENLFLMITACVLGLLAAALTAKRRGNEQIPFGPALSAAAVLTLLFGEPVVSWYLGLF